MREILRFGLLLGLVCAISAGTLTGVYSVVSVKIEENNRLEAIRKRKAVLPEAASFVAVERDGQEIHFGLDDDGAPVGTAMTVSQRGYAGPIKMTVGIGLDSRLTGHIQTRSVRDTGSRSQDHKAGFSRHVQG